MEELKKTEMPLSCICNTLRHIIKEMFPSCNVFTVSTLVAATRRYIYTCNERSTVRPPTVTLCTPHKERCSCSPPRRTPSFPLPLLFGSNEIRLITGRRCETMNDHQLKRQRKKEKG